ncbi:cob(I)yrinic acid a,c-diamide adenosyltransferase [Cupriavidus necator]|uniref:Corrinoid adenosyltransferase n=1 Tax=Cupriavidus necator (strain ATCC 17699 / DSM 428 / KCTC 22496 / NCIMB 10442 / H16 / Stanier 337) TaxID=381666 RepID=Q0K7H6_CUPNH|nr:cob(I)yrinic acid a,c-diamide adenosyltransferase [Cupriavidus necator]KUE87679.1 cob(I)yrinic acid a,c-diamide adenosyltransferase [Cupriavidus necator]QCC01811.1 cob(I)yrinic acid a,c-diamide adenosyltransferase [Cupriavidus necator H16]QQB75358.1 cob(I)yrinic acid a,c-diamide adenosyltransferase [Cupriavidus necator]WKA40211.1 cob(I)yrinic acid a,c-diamide adenosyltransferase [Cupriavidus necator]CAJ94045.1 Cob(I)alamin adenosyltransferase (BtuR) [Cupriavidus necator H16]
MTDTQNPPAEDPDRDARHKARMERKKEIVDARIAAAQDERGVIVITTGNGKGKSSSGFGMVVRALGHGMRTGVVQFIKGAQPTGEEMFLRRFPDECAFHVMGEGYTWETQDRARDVAKAEAAWEVARGMLRDPGIGLVLFDELNIALKLHYLDVEQVIADLRARPPMQHVVITGRGAPPALVETADTVTDMTPVKHAFQQGIKAQRGVEM